MAYRTSHKCLSSPSEGEIASPLCHCVSLRETANINKHRLYACTPCSALIAIQSHNALCFPFSLLWCSGCFIDDVIYQWNLPFFNLYSLPSLAHLHVFSFNYVQNILYMCCAVTIPSADRNPVFPSFVPPISSPTAFSLLFPFSAVTLYF